MQALKKAAADFTLPELPQKIREQFPYAVTLMGARHEMRQWCKDTFGDWATRSLEGSWYIDETAKWDCLGDCFHFAKERDAIAFKMYWG